MVISLLNELNILKRNIQEKDEEIKTLKKTKTPVSNHSQPKIKSSACSWSDFIAAGIERIGKYKGFQQIFITTYPQYQWGDMAKWRRTNTVPNEVLQMVQSMEFEDNGSGRGKNWTEEEHRYLHEIFIKYPHKKGFEYADMCSKKFGRLITEGSLKSQKKRLSKWKI